MSFTEAELNKITTITKVDRITLGERLDYYAAHIDSDTETAVRTELTRWTTAGDRFVRLRATESNKGVETSSEDAKADIRQNIATLLFLTDLITGSSQSAMVRG